MVKKMPLEVSLKGQVEVKQKSQRQGGNPRPRKQTAAMTKRYEAAWCRGTPSGFVSMGQWNQQLPRTTKAILSAKDSVLPSAETLQIQTEKFGLSSISPRSPTFC